MLSIDSYGCLTILFCKKRSSEITKYNWSITISLICICQNRLFGVKPSSAHIMDQLDPHEQTSMKFWSKYEHFFSCTKLHLKMISAKWKPFCLGLTVLINKPSFTGLPWRFVSLVWSASASRADDKNEALEFKTWTEWPPFCRRHFQTDFAERKFCILIRSPLKSIRKPKGSKFWG